MDDRAWMRLALEEAKAAAALGEVPVGALVVRSGELIAKAHNRRETGKSALAHAECLAIDEACKTLGGWRFVSGCRWPSSGSPSPAGRSSSP